MFVSIDQVKPLELFFDVVQLLDILVVFFTPIPLTDTSEYILNWRAENMKQDKLGKFNAVEEKGNEMLIDMRYIAGEYLRSHFAMDFLACFPGFVTMESVLWLYPFKVLRLNKIPRLMAFQNKIANILKMQYMRSMIKIDNVAKVIQTAGLLCFSIHILACCFIAVGHMHYDSEAPSDRWLVREGYEDTHLYQFEAYVTSWYFICTTCTTIGYGDLSATTPHEKIFVIFLEFAGILLFTMI